ncbi:MAG: hypothetical protein RIR48_2851, partial [Bacteroidota bacterium]
FYWSLNGKDWKKYPNSFEVSSFTGATLTLFGIGEGEFKVKEFKYIPINY